MLRRYMVHAVLLSLGVLFIGCPIWIDWTPPKPGPITEEDLVGRWYMEFNWCCDNSSGDAYVTFLPDGSMQNEEMSVDSCNKSNEQPEKGLETLSSLGESEAVSGEKVEPAYTWHLYNDNFGNQVLEYQLGYALYRCINPGRGGHLAGGMSMPDYPGGGLEGCWDIWKQQDY